MLGMVRYFVEQKYYKDRVEVSLLSESVAAKKGYKRREHRRIEDYELFVDVFYSRVRAKRYCEKVREVGKVRR